MQSDRELLEKIIGENSHWGDLEDVLDKILKEFQRKPKEKIKARIVQPRGKTYYFIYYHEMISNFKIREDAIKWCKDRGVEIIEDN